MGRPATKPKKLKDGYYIEYSSTEDQMNRTIKTYERSKEVVILGESKNGKFVNSEEVHVVD